MKIQPCLRCGFCCKRAPCGHGKLAEGGGCAYLEEIAQLGNFPIYTCGIYGQIIAKPGWEFSPAFGAGCSSSLFNDARDGIIQGLNEIYGKAQV